MPSLKLIAKAPEAMDGWNTIVSFWGPAYFHGRTDSFITKHFRYLKWRNPHLYELYARLM